MARERGGRKAGMDREEGGVAGEDVTEKDLHLIQFRQDGSRTGTGDRNQRDQRTNWIILERIMRSVHLSEILTLACRPTATSTE